MKRTILFFEEINDDDLSFVGAKALNIAKLYNTNFPVPNGFCISTNGYKEFLNKNELNKYLHDQILIIDGGLETVSKVSKNISDTFMSLKIPPDLSKRINEASCQLSKNGMTQAAVRSSAIYEDSRNVSFAGQYETFLCNNSEGILLDNIKRCWASLWTERAILYRSRNNINHKEVTTAVIVHMMIPSEVSGVLFTVNPVSNNQDEMVINSTWGLGETLGDGKVDSDYIIVSKKTGRVKDYEVGGKQCVSVPGNGEGTITRENTKKRAACLTNLEIKKLSNLGKKIETLEDAPQDIEWAIWKNKIYLLQSRPVTTIILEKEEHWTADNAQEAYPGVVSPLSADFIHLFLNNTFNKIAGILGCKENNLQFAKTFDGHFYINFTSFQKIVKNMMPGVDEELITRQLLSNGKQGDIQLKFGLDVLKLLPVGLETLYGTLRAPSKTNQLFKKFTKKLDDYLASDIDKYKPEEIIDAYNSLIEMLFQDDMVYVLYCNFAYLVSFSYLCKVINSLPEELGVTPSVFFTGLDVLEDAKIEKLISKLVLEADNDTSIRNLILTEDISKLSEKIKYLKPSEFKKSFDDFFEKYGHLSNKVLDLMVPRWIEDQSLIWKVLKATLRSENKENKVNLNTINRNEALGIVNKYLSKNKHFLPVKKWEFNIALKMAVKYVPYRENLRFEIIKALYMMRKLALRSGQLLKDSGHLEKIDDIFLLHWKEIKDALNGYARIKEIQRSLTKRKSDLERWKHINPPRHIFKRGERLRKIYEEMEIDSEVLKGIPVSAGRVTGKARVLIDISEVDKLQKGEIIVARFTDPSWTPLFSLAKAIVVDIGSVLSHSSIIARELGIPTVVGVRFGTDVIQDGQEITVDGSTGKVLLRSSSKLTA